MGAPATDGPPINERVGDYLLRRYLTQGGMAALFLGHHVSARNVVVVKRVLPQFSRDLSFTRMFSREAHIASVLRHPNIVEVYDSGALDSEGCYFVMEYIHGVDLSHFLGVLRSRNQAMPIDHALAIVLGMCEGLHHAHQQTGEDGQLLEIVHRDVSPSNIMVAFDGSIKVMDFGVAKALALTSFTEAGTRKGKLSYMAPEQARADSLDRRSDVFAIGAVLYELTTMRRLFTGDNELAVIHQLMYEARTRPSEVVPGYPPALERIVLKAVAHDPKDRFGTAAEMGAALRDFAYNAGVTPDSATLGGYLRQQVTPPPHPAEDPTFFEDAAGGALTSGETTAIEPAMAVLDTIADARMDPSAPGTYARPPSSAPAVGATVAYQPTPSSAAGSIGPAPSGGLSAGARVGLLVAAIVTVAASGLTAYMLTRTDETPTSDAKAADVPDTPAPPVSAETPAPAAETPAEPVPNPALPEGAGLVVPAPGVDTPDVAAPPVVPDAVADDPSVADEGAGKRKSTRGKRGKKKGTGATSTPQPPPPDPPPAADPDPPKPDPKPKRNPTDRMLPILGD